MLCVLRSDFLYKKHQSEYWKGVPSWTELLGNLLNILRHIPLITTCIISHTHPHLLLEISIAFHISLLPLYSTVTHKLPTPTSTPKTSFTLHFQGQVPYLLPCLCISWPFRRDKTVLAFAIRILSFFRCVIDVFECCAPNAVVPTDPVVFIVSSCMMQWFLGTRMSCYSRIDCVTTFLHANYTFRSFSDPWKKKKAWRVESGLGSLAPPANYTHQSLLPHHFWRPQNLHLLLGPPLHRLSWNLFLGWGQLLDLVNIKEFSMSSTLFPSSNTK